MQNSDPDNITLSLPDQKNYEISYGLALKLAAEKLTSLADLAGQCARSGAECSLTGSHQQVRLSYLNQTYQISLPAVEIRVADNPATVELRDRILILNYFLRARGTALAGRWIAYPELKEGANYYPTFLKRAVKSLIDFFGNAPESILAPAAALGAVRASLGDLAVTIPAFPRVPVTLVLWKGDDEFPPNANILFDSTVQDYLSAEDINVLCQTISWQLVKTLRDPAANRTK